jgi:hypothetical protein
MAAANCLHVRINHAAVGSSGGCRSERILIFGGGLETDLGLGAELGWHDPRFAKTSTRRALNACGLSMHGQLPDCRQPESWDFPNRPKLDCEQW